MKAFKKIVLVLAVVLLLIVGGVLAIGFTSPQVVEVEETEMISASPSVIFPYINDLEKFHQWEPWGARDESMQVTYGDKTVGVGASFSWESQNSGAGKLTIIESVRPEYVRTEVEFQGGGDPADSKLALEPVEGGTNVTWSFRADFGGNPFLRALGRLLIKPGVGGDYAEGLSKLKALIESETTAN